MRTWTIDSSKTVTLDTTAIPFAVHGRDPLEGRGDRLREIAKFNNVCEIVCGRATRGEIRRDGYFFRATNAVARGVALYAGLDVYALGGDHFVAMRHD